MTATAPRLGRALAFSSTLAAFALGPSVARATLGGDVASVAGNAQAFAAHHEVKKLALGERHEMTLPSGLVIREYVSPTGAVYAVTWRGPRMPDLRELLGPYFGELANNAAGAGHHRLHVTERDLVVRAIGHGRSFAGRAYIPSLVPAGVQVDTLAD